MHAEPKHAGCVCMCVRVKIMHTPAKAGRVWALQHCGHLSGGRPDPTGPLHGGGDHQSGYWHSLTLGAHGKATPPLPGVSPRPPCRNASPVSCDPGSCAPTPAAALARGPAAVTGTGWASVCLRVCPPTARVPLGGQDQPLSVFVWRCP